MTFVNVWLLWNAEDLVSRDYFRFVFKHMHIDFWNPWRGSYILMFPELRQHSMGTLYVNCLSSGQPFKLLYKSSFYVFSNITLCTFSLNISILYTLKTILVITPTFRLEYPMILSQNLLQLYVPKEDIWSVPQCIMLLCYSGSTSHNAQCFHDDHDQFSQFSPHCRIHAHSSIILKDTVWIAEFSWFSSLFGIFKALLSLENLNR